MVWNWIMVSVYAFHANCDQLEKPKGCSWNFHGRCASFGSRWTLSHILHFGFCKLRLASAHFCFTSLDLGDVLFTCLLLMRLWHAMVHETATKWNWQTTNSGSFICSLGYMCIQVRSKVRLSWVEDNQGGSWLFTCKLLCKESRLFLEVQHMQYKCCTWKVCWNFV